MLEGIADFLLVVLDLFLIDSSSKKKRDFKIDQMVKDWCNKVGLHPQYEYKDEKFRSLNVIDDSGNKYQIQIEELKWKRVKVSAIDNAIGQKKRIWNKKSEISHLTKTLYQAYGVIEQWIVESGNTRT